MPTVESAPYLHTEISIHISEIDPALHYSGELYDDKGNVIGHEDEDTFRSNMAQLEGKRRFYVTIVYAGQQFRVASPAVEPEHRSLGLGSALGMITESFLRKMELECL